MRRIVKTLAVILIILLSVGLLAYPRARTATAASFSEWTENYLKSGAPLSEGIALAKARRPEMLELIKHNPEEAHAKAIPADVREKLPREILAELEQPF